MPLSHPQRLRRWQNLCPPATRFLVTEVDRRLAPIVEAQGFVRVEVCLGDPEWTVAGSEITLERVAGNLIDAVTFSFWKYRTPIFQVHFSRWSVGEARVVVRSGNLVPRGSKYFHLWGKPWWLPLRFWSDRASERTIAAVESRLPEVFRFLETGHRGSAISRPVEARAPDGSEE